jgi:alpha-1,2-mannosyltransferase
MDPTDDGSSVGGTDSGARLKVWLPAAGAVILLAAVVVGEWRQLFAGPQPFVFVDLDYYRTALENVVAGEPLIAALPYPPIAVLVISPLGGLSVLIGNQVWTAVTLLVGIGLAFLFARRALTARGVAADPVGLIARGSVAAALLVVSVPFQSQLENGQVTLLVTALAAVDLAGVLPRRWQGVAIGAAAAVKLLPLIFIPYYLVTGQWRRAVVATGTFGLVTGIGFALFPADSAAFWSGLDRSNQFGEPSRADNLSIQAAVYRWLPSLGSVRAVWLAVALVVVTLAMLRARQHYRRGERFASALVVAASAVVVSPISWPHYHVWLPLVAIWLVLGSRRPRVQLIGLGIYAAYSLPALALLDLLLGRALIDVMVAVPILIGVFGLPHLPDHPADCGRDRACGLSRRAPNTR